MDHSCPPNPLGYPNCYRTTAKSILPACTFHARGAVEQTWVCTWTKPAGMGGEQPHQHQGRAGTTDHSQRFPNILFMILKPVHKSGTVGIWSQINLHLQPKVLWVSDSASPGAQTPIALYCKNKARLPGHPAPEHYPAQLCSKHLGTRMVVLLTKLLSSPAHPLCACTQCHVTYQSPDLPRQKGHLLADRKPSTSYVPRDNLLCPAFEHI